MTSPAPSPAGPSRHRRKPTAENWDDDFDFVPPSRPGGTSTARKQSRHLHEPSGESRANQASTPVHDSSRRASGHAAGKAKEIDEGNYEDWDVESRWNTPAPASPLPYPTATTNAPRRASIQLRRGSKGSTALVLPGSPAKPLGPMRTSPSSTSPLSSSPTRPAYSARDIITARQALLEAPRTAPLRMSPPRHPDSVNTGKLIKRHPSASFAIPPSTTGDPLQHQAASNDSSSSVASWSKLNRSPPNLPPSPVTVPGNTRDRARPLRHMKSGDMMPPPPLPGSGLLRRKSKKAKDEVERQQAGGQAGTPELSGSPVWDQTKDAEGKRGFWKRLSVNSAASAKGSPTSVHTQESRRRRSSSIGSPTKIRQALVYASGAAQPPIPPLPSTFRSPSAASSASASSSMSGISVEPVRPKASGGLTGILRRSTSSLIRKSPSASRVNSAASAQSPPTSYSPLQQSPAPAVIPPMLIPARTTSRSSQTSVESENYGTSDGSGWRNASISRGYHLPSPAPGSPYRRGSHFAAGSQDAIPPLPRSSSSVSQESMRLTENAVPREKDDVQITPKKRRTKPGSSQGSAKLPQGWAGGEGWSGFPAMRRDADMPHLPSRTTSQTDIRKHSSQPMQAAQSESPVIAKSEDQTVKSTFSTLRRLSSLSKKHGRRLSGGFKLSASAAGQGVAAVEVIPDYQADKARRGSRLETVAGSPVKAVRTKPDTYTEAAAARSETEAGSVDQPGLLRPGSDSAPSSSFRKMTTSSSASRNLHDEWIAHADPTPPNPMPRDPPGPYGAVTEAPASNAECVKIKSDKERRRQSWNDFVIPRNVLDKQRELKKGIEGVKRFANGVESLKALIDARASLVIDSGLSSLDAEYEQWWEMATVLIEVGSTGQAPSLSASPTPLDLVPESQNRSRRITLAADEAALATDTMRRALSTPHHPHLPTSSSAFLMTTSTDKSQSNDIDREPRKSSLPDPQDAGLLLTGPPRASPDLWRASTGRQDLSKRQLEVLRNMLRTPVNDSSVPTRSPNLDTTTSTGMSASSTASRISELHTESLPHTGIDPKAQRGVGHALRPSISRAATADSQASGRSLVHFGCPPQDCTRTSTPRRRGPESFPSPNDSAYIVPSQSFPSPMTASTLALGVPRPPDLTPSSEAELQLGKMRRGSKVGLAGLREFLKGLKGQKSAADLRAEPTLPAKSVRGPPSRHNSSTDAAKGYRQIAASPALETGQRDCEPPTGQIPMSSTRTPPQASSSTAAGPPVTGSGKERRRPGLVGIFRGGSGTWSDLVRDASERKPEDSESHGAGGGAGMPVIASRLIDMRSTSDPAYSSFGLTPAISDDDSKDQGDRTIRPRKSRIMGLGWPDEASSVRDQARAWSDPNAELAGATAMRTGRKDSWNVQETGGRIPPIEAGFTIEALTESRTQRQQGEGEEEATVALTPESLPILLEYLRQCETKLKEWRDRAEMLAHPAERGAVLVDGQRSTKA